jgi:hypothetical protein
VLPPLQPLADLVSQAGGDVLTVSLHRLADPRDPATTLLDKLLL